MWYSGYLLGVSGYVSVRLVALGDRLKKLHGLNELKNKGLGQGRLNLMKFMVPAWLFCRYKVMYAVNGRIDDANFLDVACCCFKLI